LTLLVAIAQACVVLGMRSSACQGTATRPLLGTAGGIKSVQALSDAGSWSEAVAVADRNTFEGGASDQLLVAAVEATCRGESRGGGAAGWNGAGGDGEELCGQSLKWCLRIKCEELRAATAMKHIRKCTPQLRITACRLQPADWCPPCQQNPMPTKQGWTALEIASYDKRVMAHCSPGVRMFGKRFGNLRRCVA